MKYILIAAVILFTSCTKAKKPPHFTITKEVWDVSGSNPTLNFTVINDGELTGYNLGIDVQAKQGNTIIATAHAFPGDLGDIKPGESAVDGATFFSLTNAQAATCTFSSSMTWLNRDY